MDTRSIPAPGESAAGTGRVEALILQVLARLDVVAMGVAVGVTAGAGLGFATMWLVVRGGHEVGPRLGLLANYFPGYRVTLAGAVVGSLYAFGLGFVGGWLYAALWNLSRRLYIGWARTRQILRSGFLDNV